MTLLISLNYLDDTYLTTLKKITDSDLCELHLLSKILLMIFFIIVKFTLLRS